MLLPPSLFVAAWAYSTIVRDDGPSLVEIREAGITVGFATQAQAIATVEARIGTDIVLPRSLLSSAYDLAFIDSSTAAESPRGVPGVQLGYMRPSRSTDWFWISQVGAGQLDVPPGLPEIETSIEGATIWTLGPPADPIAGNPQHMQFIARTSRYDRVISFQGPPFPAEFDARRLIESVIGQD